MSTLPIRKKKYKTHLWAYLAKHKLSQQDFALAMGVSIVTVAHWMHGRHDPSLYHALKVIYLSNNKIKLEQLVCTDQSKQLLGKIKRGIRNRESAL